MLGRVLGGLGVGDLARALTPGAQPVDEPRAPVEARAAQRELVGAALADPALVLRTRVHSSQTWRREPPARNGSARSPRSSVRPQTSQEMSC